MRVVHRARWWRGALAVAAGALPVLAFPAPSLWWWAYGALVPWMLLLRSADGGRRAAVEGWLGGVGFLLAGHHWLAPSLHVFLVVVAALVGLLWAPWGWLVHRLLAGAPGPGRALAAVALVPSAWLTVELVRSWEYLGGPWALLGASQWQVPAALRLASLGGVWLVTVWVVAVNTSLTLLGTAPRARRAAAAATVACALLPVAVWAWAPPPRPGDTVRVAVVQPGVVEGADVRFDTGERLTRSLAGRGADLVVWGESSVGYDLDDRPDLRERLAELSARVDAPLLVNVDARRSDRPGIFKSSVLVGPDGPTGDRYDKMRLVPFGEYVPARSLLDWATAVGRAAEEDRGRGDAPVVMETAAVRPGPLVCFESAFPDMSRALVREGAGLLVAQSATSTFQESWAPRQHASLAALRAAETGRPVVHATLTGVSAAYGPRGEPVGEPLGTDRSGAVVYEVPLASGTSPYVRFGDWVPAGALGALAAAGVSAAGRGRGWGPRPGRRRGAGRHEAADTVRRPAPARR
ncbi:apolipoprotein N-acyltransferase [Streptomyces sp. TRM43335]|uniref:Apolipoprotein N-acyltransferase n=1 Tax=Streptomyces taklimakanensis TaxID=2569853 RepID=A0A6G2BJ88_9ACTN|nr:apolipoprotein N-acyltransferase [Streptomyces taklimakanensis]MTE22123.1 apolipoprotein N-acyltransferase [Streptomyces taklimakanensis]